MIAFELQVLLRYGVLGLGLATGQLLVWNGTSCQFGFYLSILTFFHYSEFFVTALINPSVLSLDSFLLNHSEEYGIEAAVSSLLLKFTSSTVKARGLSYARTSTHFHPPLPQQTTAVAKE